MIYQIINIVSLFFTSLKHNKGSIIKYLLITGLTALLISSCLFFGAYYLFDKLGHYISSKITWTWAKESRIFTTILSISGILFFFATVKYILLIVLSPLLSYVSEKTENNVTGDLSEVKFSFFSSVARSVRINMRNLIKEMFLSLLLFVVGFIPVLNILSLPLLLMVQTYFTGFGIMDYYLERHYTFKETINIVYTHKWAAMSLGFIFIVLMLIPVVGIILAPYFATVAATRYFVNSTNMTTLTKE